MPHLTCPSCGLTLSESAASSPLQPCPRCLLRQRVVRTMEVMRGGRFQRTGSSRGFGRSSRPTLAHGLPSTTTTSAVKSSAPRISDEPTP
jgi:hypothetical protein